MKRNIRKFLKILLKKEKHLIDDYDGYDKIVDKFIARYLGRKCNIERVKSNRIIENSFYITTQYTVGYVTRENGHKWDKDRDSFCYNNKKHLFLLYAEINDGEYLEEQDIGHFTNLKSAINWVGRYGCPYSNIVQYYYISRRYVYHIWNNKNSISFCSSFRENKI